MSLDQAIQQASAGENVSADVLETAFRQIMEGEASPVQIAALLIALRTKGETVSEIVSVAKVLRSKADSVAPGLSGIVDTCGTGGDASGTFNISTTAAFVVAGAGVPVAKHGNRAASSRTGSVDVLEHLGVNVDLSVAASASILKQIGIATFFARRAHPAMRHVAPVRGELKVRTIMNCLGPLLNPVGAEFQVLGVYASELLPKLAAALGQLGTKRALLVHGEDGLDEITTCAVTQAVWVDSEGQRALQISPEEVGIRRASLGELQGGDAAKNAEIIRRVLAGDSGPARDIVVLNAAAALWVAGAAATLQAGVELAGQSIDAGAAQARLEALIAASQQAKTQ